MTREATIDSIANFKVSAHRSYYYNYHSTGERDDEISVAYSGLKYVEHFRSDGTMESRGLYSGYREPVGTWWYCNSAGKDYKEFDYSTQRTKLISPYRDKYQWVFDSVLAKSKSDLSLRLGEHYVQNHVTFSPYVSWYCANGHGQDKYPQMPIERPTQYHVTASIVYSDSITVAILSLSLDSLFNLVNIDSHDAKDIKRGTFHLNFGEAQMIASNHGFNTPSLRWHNGFGQYYWVASRCVWDSASRSYVSCDTRSYSAKTGKAKPQEILFLHETSCPTHTDYTVDCADSITVSQGQKKVVFAGATFVSPLDWIPTTRYIGYRNKCFITNTTDTIFGEEICGRAMRRLHFDVVNDTATENQLKRKLGKNYQGRHYYFNCEKFADGSYSIYLEFIEDISSLGCGGLQYTYWATAKDEKSRDAIVNILSTIHFSKCMPEGKLPE